MHHQNVEEFTFPQKKTKQQLQQQQIHKVFLCGKKTDNMKESCGDDNI